MNVTFRIRFATRPGQSLWLAGDKPIDRRVPMQYRDRNSWEIEIQLPDDFHEPLRYFYILRESNGAETADWGRDRDLIPAGNGCMRLLVIDSWNHAGYIENAFYTAPFKKILLAGNLTEIRTNAPKTLTHTFRVKAPLLGRGQTVCLLGEGEVLGHWKTMSPVLLSRRSNEDYFSVQLDLRGQAFPVAYKYGVFDIERNSFVRFEDGANRVLDDEIAPDKNTVLNDGFLNLPVARWRGAGVAVPVFSLRTKKSFGVGEFADLKLLADWGREIGLKLIQLLPINDTSATHSWRDSYPYAAISAFALHPLYLNLDAVTTAENRKWLKPLEAERKRLNALETLDYERVMKAKLRFLRTIFPLQKAATFCTTEYQSFFTDNQSWLVPYAAFCVLRDRFGTPDFDLWPEHNRFDAEKVAELAERNDEMAFHYFVQFHLHRQLRDAAKYIHAAGLVLKGDLAIGVCRHGADTWQQPELFHMDMQAGAPPDAFSATGQNWSFPTYNWPRMADDGYAWWKRRFAQMANYFDAFRIDHILGFFRIWSSPAHAVEGILGHFVPAISVEPGEFAARGIVFDRDRLVEPFITDGVLAEVCGSEADFIRQHFLTTDASGRYALKPEFSTQRQVEDYFSAQSPGERNARLKSSLFKLVSNVILLEAGEQFHFRFAMDQTLSFKLLPPVTQAKLRELYVDYFFRRQDGLWRREAMQKLPALKRETDMLICGEDLGLVPACVPETMKDLGLLGLEIQRMSKAPGATFSRPADAPYLSVVTPSTHDMSTIRGWWTEDSALTQRFYNEELGLSGKAPGEARPEIVRAIVRQHLASPAMWSIFQWQDLLGQDARLRRVDVDAERINVPAKPDFYWRYRLHLTLEELLEEEKFNRELAEQLRDAGR